MIPEMKALIGKAMALKFLPPSSNGTSQFTIPVGEIMDLLKLVTAAETALRETEERQRKCAMRHDVLAKDGESFCSSCGVTLKEEER